MENQKDSIASSVKTEKKSIKEYLLEGLMIFIAVMLGFIAENIRENSSDRANEKQYMSSLIKDINDDIINIRDQQKVVDRRLIFLDSLIDMLNDATIPTNTNDLYYYARLATKNNVFAANTRTIDQMKNAGGYRVIKNDKVSSEIMSYYSLMAQIKSLEDTEQSEDNEYRKIAVQIFNAKVFNRINSSSPVIRPENNPPLRTNDKKLLADLSGWVHYIRNTQNSINAYKNVVREQGEKLIQLIQKEYHLE